MKPFFTKPFIHDYQRLTERIQRIFNKQLKLLLKDYRHPSLQLAKLRGDIWYARVTQSYRFTFQISGNTYILRRIGKHDIEKTP